MVVNADFCLRGGLAEYAFPYAFRSLITQHRGDAPFRLVKTLTQIINRI